MENDSKRMNQELEINRGYIDHVRHLNRERSGADSAPATRGWRAQSMRWWLRAFLARPYVSPFVLVGLSIFIEIWLRVSLLVHRPKPSQLTADALRCVDEFVEQYPFHLYPIVCKAFELAYLKRELPARVNGTKDVLEIAIGEGTLSSRVFPEDAAVVGLDLSPYSLKKASEKSHVKRAIVCDCLAPPIREGSFDVLIANNFLHHVTHKDETLARWSRLAAKAAFNENSPTWASGWPVPYLLKKIGRRERAQRAADGIEKLSLQSLESKQQ